MCGRFAQYSELDIYTNELEGQWQPVEAMPKVEPSWNVAPSKLAWVATRKDGLTAGQHMAWGFRPGWADGKMPRPINARVETAPTKPYFKKAWANSRCIVPVDCYYEWLQREDGKKTPMCIRLASGGPMLLAGLYEPPGEKDAHPCFAVITTKATGEIASLHDRKPLALAPEIAQGWLDPQAGKDDLGRIAATADERGFKWHQVSSKVNSTANDSADLIHEVA